MIRITELRLDLEHSPEALHSAIVRRLGVDDAEVLAHHVARRGYDARKPSAIRLVYTVDVSLKNEVSILKRWSGDPHISATPDTTYRPVARATHLPLPRPVVVGTGPCGLLAALILAEGGFRPIIIERGQAVRQRTRDTFGFWRHGPLDPESNVQFGEGGAGTFSDGKLYSQIKDPRHLGQKVLREFVKAGAPEEILYLAKPHIGTFRLVKMVETLRENIEAVGGEYRFGTRVDDLVIDQGRLRGLILSSGETLPAEHVIFAVGHSARDTFTMLARRGVFMEPKPFSIGVRIEHPQSVIDRARFGLNAGHPLLGAADYRLVHHGTHGRSVYSFCMCPGGTVVAAASESGGVVTNGMSQYSRSERNANSALVVGIDPKDYPGDVLAGINLQRHWEQRAYIAGGSDYHAPAQRVGDFLAGRASTSLGSVEPSYKPGVRAADLTSCLPSFVVDALREALPAFERNLPGFALEDAVLTGVETRTSSPLRMRRDPDSLQSIHTQGLYPAGEGAGYAGGIYSAAIDGIKVAEAVARAMTHMPGGLASPLKP